MKEIEGLHFQGACVRVNVYKLLEHVFVQVFEARVHAALRAEKAICGGVHAGRDNLVAHQLERFFHEGGRERFVGHDWARYAVGCE